MWVLGIKPGCPKKLPGLFSAEPSLQPKCEAYIETDKFEENTLREG